MAEANVPTTHRNGGVLTCRRCGAADPALKMFEECAHCGGVYTPEPGEEPWPLEQFVDPARKGQLDPRLEVPVLTALGILTALVAYGMWTGAWRPVPWWRFHSTVLISVVCFGWAAVRLIANAVGGRKRRLQR